MLYLVEPGGVRRCVVDIEPCQLRQLGAALSLRRRASLWGMLVSVVVVDDQMHFEFGGGISLSIRRRKLRFAGAATAT